GGHRRARLPDRAGPRGHGRAELRPGAVAGNPPPPVPAPALGWGDLAGSTVGLWGLGVEGLASLRRLEAMGVTPVLVDDRGPSDATGDHPVLSASGGGLDTLARCEVVVKSPGISRYRPEVAALAGAGVQVAGGLGLWLEEADRDRVVLVTGTKGKSTTAAVAGHLLAGLGHRCLVAGNFGRPPWDPSADACADWWVVETSSFQATDLAVSPPVVAVTSLAPDHLDWHGGVAAYFRDKLALCTRPGARTTVADGASAALRARRPQLGPEVRWVEAGDPKLDGPWVPVLGLLGEHNRRNALLARACLLALGVEGAADDDALLRAAPGLGHLDSRLAPLGTVDGVTFVDDSLSTNVLPTLAALDAFAGRRIAVLVGGHDRGIDYAPLGERLASRPEPTLVVTLPASGPRVHAAVDAAAAAHAAAGGAGVRGAGAGAGAVGGSGRTVPEVVDATDLAGATATAFEWARPDGVVLLSPAAPSFGQFRDYRDRAAAFAEAMRACAGRQGTADVGHRVTGSGAERGGSGSRRGPTPA
ncbi:MAG: UDP-N-acetylmuramoyl-L-alanine--D-glutamate ligase, partial [Acidimicrobiales bacterium]